MLEDKTLRQLGASAAVALWVFSITTTVAAQDKYPSRTIELIVPAPPGGGTDALSRLLAEVISPIVGQRVVVVNAPGAGGSLGVGRVVRALPDGYTIGSVWNSPITAVPHTLDVPYTPDSYTPIALLASGPEAFCSRSDFPANNGKELIELLKANPDKYSYGNDGVGGKMQLATERVFRRFDIKVRPVPFGGGGETMRYLLGGHVDFYTGSVPVALPHIASGKVKCLFVFGAKPSPALPNTSSLTDLGVPEEETLQWRGVIGPNGMAAETVRVLENAFRKSLDDPRVRGLIKDAGEDVTFLPGTELRKLINSEYQAIGNVARSLDLKKSK